MTWLTCAANQRGGAKGETMKQTIAVTALLWIATSAGLHAQSLEKSYAEICSTAAKKKTEACKVMGRALVAKLQRDVASDEGDGSNPTSGTSEPHSHQPAPSKMAQPAIDAKFARWGIRGKMVGKQFVTYSPGAEMHWEYASGYEWIVPGERIQMFAIGPDGQKNPAGEMRWNDQMNRIDMINLGGEAWGYQVPDAGGITSVIGETKGRTVELSDGSFRSDVYSPAVGAHISYSFENTPEGRQLASSMVRRQQQAAEAVAEAERAKKREKTERWNNAMGALYNGLQAAGEVATAHEAESRAELDATLAEAQRRAYGQSQAADAVAATHDVGDSPSPAAGSAGGGATEASKALRFVLDIGLMPKAGDTNNPQCYSNVITRAGPPGWGGRGFLPDESAEQARAEVEDLKSRFIEACEAASGRTITGEGNFHWTWNQTSDGDQQVTNARPRYREDVSVQL